jgi:hypothetical protein
MRCEYSAQQAIVAGKRGGGRELRGDITDVKKTGFCRKKMRAGGEKLAYSSKILRFGGKKWRISRRYSGSLPPPVRGEEDLNHRETEAQRDAQRREKCFLGAVVIKKTVVVMNFPLSPKARMPYYRVRNKLG